MKGSCNCGKVRFTTSEHFVTILNCHCKLCRKMSGCAFSTYVIFRSDNFILEDGYLKSIKISENASKRVCATCTTPIYNENPKYEGFKIVYLGAMDNAEHLSPLVDTYCESQLEWLTTMDNIKKMEQGFS